MLHYHLTKPGFTPNVQKSLKSITFNYPGDDIYESSPYLITLPPGKFRIEAWGSSACTDGYGAYAAGTIELNESRAFYIYLGTNLIAYNKLLTNRSLYNGGGAGQRAGGGASDLRLFGGEWDDFSSLKSRILVAAGAGSMDCNGHGGDGGELRGSDSTSSYYKGYGGNQTHGGFGFVSGSFGKGGSMINLAPNGALLDSTSGAGSGYYGGGTGQSPSGCGAGGGSSFISGHKGCNAISESSKENNIIPTNQSIHYSGIYFTDTKMIGGRKEMPLPSGIKGIGYEGKGVVKITSPFPIKYELETCLRKKYNSRFYFILLFLFVQENSISNQ